MFLPIPAFRAAFDQQGSRWTLQAVRMNGYVGNIHLLPEQAQIISPLLILIFIPIFNRLTSFVDTLNNGKYRGAITHLRKISVGMFITGIAFCTAALIQNEIDRTLTKSPEVEKEMALRVVNLAGREFNGSFTVSNGLDLDERLGQEVFVPVGAQSIIKKSIKKSVEKNTSEQYINTGELIVNTETDPGQYFFNAVPFEISSGKLVWTKAVIEINDENFPTKSFDYGSWSVKDVNGKNHITIVNGLSFSVNVSVVCTSGNCLRAGLN